MPTHLTTQTPLDNSVGGGNSGQYIQVIQNTDGTFSAATGADVFGDAAGTVHLLGSQMDSGFTRDTNGQYATPVHILEQDIDHLNSLELLAPYDPTLDDPEDTLEDGTIIGGTDSVYGDPSCPYFLFAINGKPLSTDGLPRVRIFIGQFTRAGGFDQKAKARNKFLYNVKSVDAFAFDSSTLVATMTFSGTVTGPTLGSGFNQGKWVNA